MGSDEVPAAPLDGEVIYSPPRDGSGLGRRRPAIMPPALRPSVPLARFIRAKRFVLLIGIGVLLIIGGFVLEANLDEIHNVWINLTSPPGASLQSTPPQQPNAGSTHAQPSVSTAPAPHDQPDVGAAVAVGAAPPHGLTFGLLMVLLLKELGVASLVSGVVGLVIERQAKEHDSRRARELQMAVAENAIFALFGLSHDPEFIQAVVDANLKAPVVRRKMRMHYTLRPLTAEEAKLVNGDAPEEAIARFFILDMEHRYEFENVSSAPYEMTIPQTAPTRSGKGARAVTAVTFLALNGKSLDEESIKNGVDKKRTTLHEVHYSWLHMLGARGSDSSRVTVVSNVSCLKERSDNEVWGSFFPTMGDVMLTLEVVPGLNFGVRPLSSGDLRLQVGATKETEKTWILAGPLLRDNSVVFWWRTHEDEGETDESVTSTRRASSKSG